MSDTPQESGPAADTEAAGTAEETTEVSGNDATEAQATVLPEGGEADAKERVLAAYRVEFGSEPTQNDLTAINLALPRITTGEPFYWSQQGQWRVIAFGMKEENVAANTAVDDLARVTHAQEEDAPDNRLMQLKPWKRIIIEELRKIPNVSRACLMSNRTSTQSAYKARETDVLFRELWDEALESHTDAVEESLHDLAVNGHERTMYAKDGSVRSVEKVRDVNAIKFWLQGNRPKTYRETHDVNVTHDIGPNMAGVLANVRMSRDAILGGGSVRELPVTEFKVLSVNDAAKDGESCAGAKEPVNGGSDGTSQP